ncbi:hypothetical protein WCE55_02625 [Luteimonas sp. MJ293]|uniref:hypothetical protein n=1 Tax=Luteimonas sp. MJ146 TaxID=3129240 RepID=UPI0031BA0F7D
MGKTKTPGVTFPLAPTPARFRLWLWLLAGVLPVVGAGWLFIHLAARGSITPITALLGFVATVLPALLVGVGISRQVRRHRLVLGAGWIGVATGAHRRRMLLSELDLDRARVLDLDEHLEFKPRLKTNGAFVPGFQTGWYRLRNGSRALVARAGGKKMLWIPTTHDFGLLLQPRQPRDLLHALRDAAAGNVDPVSAVDAGAKPEKTYWFPAKQMGWGWGIPSAWQGWVVLGLFILGVMGLPLIGPEEWELPGIGLLVVALLVICFLKGEPPRWRWGYEDEEF